MSRILIVEDEESFSDPLSYLLEKEGFEVTVAADGNEALSVFERDSADLILLDPVSYTHLTLPTIYSV